MKHTSENGKYCFPNYSTFTKNVSSKHALPELLHVWTKTDKLSLCYYNFRTRQNKERVAAAAAVEVVVIIVFAVGTNGISTIKGIRLYYFLL